MMKNWLIRTKNNHILGPVTKDKIKQLISNSSIKGDDEVTSGNGYWLFVREKELVDKYIFGNEEQGFNPVQESLPVLTQIHPTDRRNYPVQEATDGAILPSENDLMYPGEDNSVQSQTDDTSIGINPNKSTPPKAPEKRIQSNDKDHKLNALRERAIQKPPPRPLAQDEPRSLKPQSERSQKNSSQPLKTSMSGQRLILITLLFLIIGLVLLYFRGTVVKKLIETTSVLISPVYAQTLEPAKKKNGFTNLL